MREAKVDHKLQELHHRIDVMKGLALDWSRLSYNTDPPFGAHIMREQLLKHFKMPRLETYNGLTDLIDHLESFKALMLLYRATDRILCRVFPSTLRKVARYCILA